MDRINDSWIKQSLKNALAKKGICHKHRVAAVIETVALQYVLGWNGGPSVGKEHSECLRKGYPTGEGMHLCPTVHAERRAISHAAKYGRPLHGGTLYMSEWFPCADCAKSIIEAGISKLVTPDKIYADEKNHVLLPHFQNQSYNFELAEELLREAGVAIIIDPSIKVRD